LTTRREDEQKSSIIGDFFVVLFVLAILFSIITLSPGIAVTALINLLIPMSIGPLWGTTLSVTIILLIVFAIKVEKEFFYAYLSLSFFVFILLGILTLFVSNNIFYNMVKSMYPIIFN
jgi:hypothetical protein